MRPGDWVRLNGKGLEAQRGWLTWTKNSNLPPDPLVQEVGVEEQGVLLCRSNSDVWTVRFDGQTLCLREDMMEAV